MKDKTLLKSFLYAKEILFVITFLIVILNSNTILSQEFEEARVFIDDEPLVADVGARIIDGRVMIPFRQVFESLGASVEWDGENRIIKGIKGDKAVELTIDSYNVKINNRIHTIDARPTLAYSTLPKQFSITAQNEVRITRPETKVFRTLVPLRFVAETFGAEVKWIENSRRVDIKSAEKIEEERLEQEERERIAKLQEERRKEAESESRIPVTESFISSEDFQANRIIVCNDPEKQVKLREYEQKMLQLVNEERRKDGLNELLFNEKVSAMARLRSIEMIELDYLGHESPRYGGYDFLIRDADINFRQIGENCARAATVERQHEGLMNSPGHRANILGSYNEIGIGIESDKNGKLTATQIFVNRR